MAHYSRRDFLKTGLAAAALAGAGSFPLRAARETATDWVTLGKSGVKVTRLAFGTGTYAGQVCPESYRHGNYITYLWKYGRGSTKFTSHPYLKR